MKKSKITEGNVTYTNISACGINCKECDIFKLPYDKNVQDKIIPWYKGNKWLPENEGIKEVIEKKMYCKGCNIDQDIFWSKGCKFVKCCFDDKKIINCSECDKFPCQELTEWSKKDIRYTNALNYLKEINEIK